VSNLSHELRTPLASIKALVDTLRDGAIEDPPAAEHFLERMEVEVDEMTQMVQELLELSRIESGQAPLRLFPTAVTKLIEPVIERLRAQAGRASLTLNGRAARQLARSDGRRRSCAYRDPQSGAQRHQVHAAGRSDHGERAHCVPTP
jgi:signal transduction histidine kinase